MTEIKPIGMRCNEEQFDAIRPKLKQANFKINLEFSPTCFPYLVNNYSGRTKEVACVKSHTVHDSEYNRTVFEKWNEQTFLEYCGIVSKEPRMVTTADIGAKVIPGRDWKWYDQDKDSVHGVIMSDSSYGWVRVEWISKDGKTLRYNRYRIGAENCYDLYYYEEEEFVLPEKWYVQITEENKAVLESWRKIQPGATRDYTCFNDASIGKWLINDVYDGSYLNYSESEPGGGYTGITFEQFQKYVLKEEPIMKKYKNYTVPATDVLKIRLIACLNWKPRFTRFLERIDTNNNVLFSEEEIDEMFKAATDRQRPVLVEIFGEPKPVFTPKPGDLVWCWDNRNNLIKLGVFERCSSDSDRYLVGSYSWTNIAPYNNGQIPEEWRKKFEAQTASF